MTSHALIALAAAAAALGAGCGREAPCNRLTPGAICTIAGTGLNGLSGDDGPATDADLSLPLDTLVGPDGTVFVLDWNNNRIRAIDPDGTIRLVAGNAPGAEPTLGPFNHPTAMVLEPEGDALIVAGWFTSRIHRVDLTTGEVTDVAGDGARGRYAGDGGPAADASMDLPSSVVFGPQRPEGPAGRDLVVMDQQNQVIRRIDGDGTIGRIAGQCVIDFPESIGGPGPCPDGVEPAPCPAPSNKTTCGDPAASCQVPCTPAYAPGDDAAGNMRMSQPFGGSIEPGGKMAYDDAGNLYFADTNNGLVRMIDTAGRVHRIAGVEPIDGVPQRGYSGDGGPATDALLLSPVDVAIGDDGAVYFTDAHNHCVRAVSPDGAIRTVAGVCEQRGFDGDGGPADAALLHTPFGVEVAGDRLLIADTGNHVIRAVRLPDGR